LKPIIASAWVSGAADVAGKDAQPAEAPAEETTVPEPSPQVSTDQDALALKARVLQTPVPTPPETVPSPTSPAKSEKPEEHQTPAEPAPHESAVKGVQEDFSNGTKRKARC